MSAACAVLTDSSNGLCALASHNISVKWLDEPAL
jgi:hypothetical protein